MRSALLIAAALVLQPKVPPAPPEPTSRVPAAPSAGTKVQPETPPADGIPLAGADAGIVRKPSAPDAWGGIRDGQPTLSDRVVRYEIAARLDPAKHTVDGQERLSWRNRSNKRVHAIYVHLYLNAFEGTGSTFLREMGASTFRDLSIARTEKGQWGHVDLRSVKQGGREVAVSFVHPDGGPDSDHTVARFDLPQPVEPGASTTLDIDFLAKLPRIIARTGYYGSYHLVGQWFPKIGVLELPGERGATEPRWNCHEMHLYSEFYADFGSYDVKLTVPKAFAVGATGKLAGPPQEKGGDLVHHYRQDDVHDFAWTAFDGYASPLKASWEHPGSPRVDVTVLYPPEYSPVAKPTLAATLDALTYFSDTLGPYPYETVTAVVPPYGAEESGGMEYPTFFTSIGARRYSPTWPLIDFVAIHEFGHGYFYGILASNEFEEPVLDEGLNEFWDVRLMVASGRKFGPTLPILGRLKMLGELDVWQAESRLGGALRTYPDALAGNAWKRIGNYGFVYSGTAVWFHVLEERLGGDTLLRSFREYYRRWKFRHPSTADLRAVLEEVSGDPRTVGEFFENHVYKFTAHDDRIMDLESKAELPPLGEQVIGGQRRELDREAREKEVKAAEDAWAKAHGGKQPDEKGPGPFPFRTTVVVRRYAGHLPTSVLVKFADGTETREAWPPGEVWHKFSYLTEAKAVSAQLDPERKLLADQNKLDDGHTVEPERLAGRRWALEIASVVQLALATLEAL